MLHGLKNSSIYALALVPYTLDQRRGPEDTPWAKSRSNISLSKKERKKTERKDNGLKVDGEVLLACSALDILTDNLSMEKPGNSLMCKRYITQQIMSSRVVARKFEQQLVT